MRVLKVCQKNRSRDSLRDTSEHRNYSALVFFFDELLYIFALKGFGEGFQIIPVFVASADHQDVGISGGGDRSPSLPWPVHRTLRSARPGWRSCR